MRKVTQEIVQAFFNHQPAVKSNSYVAVTDNSTTLYLHGNAIAKIEDGKLFISCAGWYSTTTKERLNGVLSYHGKGYIYQKDFVWYFDDGSEFDEGWNLITTV